MFPPSGQQDNQQQSKNNGKSKAAGIRSIQSITYPALSETGRKKANRRFVLWGTVNFRPENMLHNVGFKIFVGNLAPDYVARVMIPETFKDHLMTLYVEVRDKVMAEIEEHRQSCLKVGYQGPFRGGQLGLTTIANEEYITFSVSFIPVGEVTVKRNGLATRAFPGQYTATDVTFWVEKVHGRNGFPLRRFVCF